MSHLWDFATTPGDRTVVVKEAHKTLSPWAHPKFGCSVDQCSIEFLGIFASQLLLFVCSDQASDRICFFDRFYFVSKRQQCFHY